MNRKGESACGALALILVVLFFTLMQMQFKGWEKKTVAIKEEVEVVRIQGYQVRKDFDAFLQNLRVTINFKKVFNHTHKGMFGEVKR